MSGLHEGAVEFFVALGTGIGSYVRRGPIVESVLAGRSGGTSLALWTLRPNLPLRSRWARIANRPLRPDRTLTGSEQKRDRQ